MLEQPPHEPLPSLLRLGLPDPDDTVAAGTRSFTPEALRLLLACSRHLAMGLAHALSRWWRRGDPVQGGVAACMLVRVELAPAYHSTLRPHQGLGGATPAEVYLGETPAAQNVVRPPRKRVRDSTGDEPLPFEVVFLDPERCMPVLVPISKAA